MITLYVKKKKKKQAYIHLWHSCIEKDNNKYSVLLNACRKEGEFPVTTPPSQQLATSFRLSSPLIFITLHVSLSTPGYSSTSACPTWTHQFCSQPCVSTVFLVSVNGMAVLPMTQGLDLLFSSTKLTSVHTHTCTHMCTHTYTVNILLILANFLSRCLWNPHLRLIPPSANLI